MEFCRGVTRSRPPGRRRDQPVAIPLANYNLRKVRIFIKQHSLAFFFFSPNYSWKTVYFNRWFILLKLFTTYPFKTTQRCKNKSFSLSQFRLYRNLGISSLLTRNIVDDYDEWLHHVTIPLGVLGRRPGTCSFKQHSKGLARPFFIDYRLLTQNLCWAVFFAVINKVIWVVLHYSVRLYRLLGDNPAHFACQLRISLRARSCALCMEPPIRETSALGLRCMFNLIPNHEFPIGFQTSQFA